MLRVGHRGAPGLAPANTMASFRAAVDLGCDWVECDIRPTLDGILAISHDPAVKDRGGRVYPIHHHTARELASLDLGRGEGVPTLDDLVAYAIGRCGIMVDVKCDGYEAEIGAALSPLAPIDLLVPGAGPEGRRRFRELFPILPISLSIGADAETQLLYSWDTLDTDAVTLHHSLVTEDRIAQLHKRGIRVFAWTVDDLPTLRRLAGIGVDGLISNRADLLVSI